MRFDHLLIGFLLLTFFVIGGTYMIADYNSNYGSVGVNISDDEFGSVYNTSSRIYDITESGKEHTLEGEISDTDSWESMTKGSYSALRLVRDSIGMFGEIANAIAETLHIPVFIVGIASTAFALFIIFGIIYMIFRYKD